MAGKTLYQGDSVSYKGMAQEAIEYSKATGDVALWTNSMFSGMPTYQIAAPQKHNLLNYIYKTLKLGFSKPIGYFILGMFTFYFMMLILGFNSWISLISSFAFSFLTNNIFLLEAGHMSKISAIMITPLIMAGVILLLRKNYIKGGIIFAISMGMELLSNHVQMTYYFGLVVAILVIIEYIRYIRDKDFKAIGMVATILIIGIILAVGSSASKLWTTYEYSKETMRGKPILKIEGEAKSSSETQGLEWNYAMQWSNSTLDLFSTFIPGVVGGGSSESPVKDSKLAKLFRGQPGFNTSNFKEPLYWGALPFTSGPPYMGALVMFLFVLGLLTERSRYKWWALISISLLFLLSLGKNMEFFNKFFYDYFPLYNKFRTPNSILGLAGIPIVFLAFLTFRNLIVGKYEIKSLLRNLWITLCITGGIALFFLLFGSSFFGFTNENDANYQKEILDALISDRKSLMVSDSFRTLAIVLISAGIIWAFIKKFINSNIILILAGVIIFFDLLTVDMRYVNHDSYITQKNLENTFTQRDVDKQILADPDPYYRVFDLSVNSFNSSIPSYWHKNIGGYHAAKLQRYQDMIDRYISKGDKKVLNMLNTKYIIQKQDKKETVFQNSEAFGNAWFVDSIKIVNDANSEIDEIANTNVSSTAIVNEEFTNYVSNFDPETDGTIKLTNYSPNKLEYEYTNNGEGLAVFSEVWYGEKDSWRATIDGKPAEFIRADYILRALKTPAGSHIVTFEFKPVSYYMGENISLFSSLLMILLLIGYLYYHYFYSKKNKHEADSES